MKTSGILPPTRRNPARAVSAVALCLVLACALLVAARPAAAHDYTSGDLTIHHPYAFVTAPTAMTGAGYVKAIVNAGPGSDRLIAVKSGFPRTELHESTESDGVSSMRPVGAVEIPPGGTVELAPGGIHIMFMGLDGNPLAEGTMVPVTLVFEKAGEIAVEFKVQPRREDEGQAMQGMDHGAKGTAP